MLENKKFFIKTHGCQMNEYDSGKLTDVLKINLKMIETKEPQDADLLLLNTCSIREKAQEKVFHQLGRWKKLKDKKPSMLIAVGGCVASQEGKSIRSRAPSVDIIFGPQTIHRIPKMIKEIYSSDVKTSVDVSFPEIEKFDYLPSSAKKAPSAYLSIMEGCSKYCTFCVVPYTRGEEFNRKFDDIITEAVQLSEEGAKEIILLGQNVNAYKSYDHNKNPVNLSDLIRYISHIDGIDRIRYTTSHPIDFSQDLIDEYRNPKLANNLHLPIQSGSDLILSKMKRKHTVVEYKSIIRKIRSIRPDIHLSSDFIVGYPGESDYEFQKTLDFISELNFSDAYSFIYSPRPGTPAAQEIDNLSDKIKSDRLKELKDLVKQQSIIYTEKMIGKTEKVLVEGISLKRNNEVFGRTDNNKVINFSGDRELISKFVNVHIDEMRANTLHGTYLNSV
ncbi:MAG: tRNA (N6-isopentenyl adenosine(37)-C2)-methylthiotransferase MiaB [Gammaproteobacteria bacterium]|nr:tRNA (N6-isopentenyl adenosine(37)-C2)-methylthiotransferase MiaB [Gammaproteobacteria bacterium]|tara:strand:- start:15878 stop:17215 length:1338 start_codon:yes stop_codon:yes gene_type:complete